MILPDSVFIILNEAIAVTICTTTWRDDGAHFVTPNRIVGRNGSDSESCDCLRSGCDTGGFLHKTYRGGHVAE